MRDLRGDDAALSEIVGALMLIVIVSVAATSLALFVQSQQKEIQAHEALALEGRLERLEITRVIPTPDGPSWAKLNFTVISHTTLQTFLFNMAVNGHPLENYDLVRFDRDTKKWVPTAHTYEDDVRLESREQVHIHLEVAGGLFGAPEILTTDAIVFEIVTARGNHFDAAFIPPTAVAIVEIHADHLILDGRLSDHAGTNARIVHWKWTVDDGVDVIGKTGRVLRSDRACDTAYTVTLTVIDNLGLTATSDEVTVPLEAC
jgi:hypothetical protein